MKEKNIATLTIDTSHIKVTFEELFYDLIFVIIISKISELITSTTNITFTLLVSSLGLFLFLIFSWRIRLIHNNQVHILSNQTNSRMANIKIVTFIEIVLMTLIIHDFDTMSYQFIIALIFVIAIATFFTVTQVRENLFNYLEGDHEKFTSILHNIKRRNRRLINIDYISERYGIIIILFLGEILATAFLNIDSNIFLLNVLILLLLMFNRIVKILDFTKEKIKIDADRDLLFRRMNRYFTKLLINLLCIIIILEYSVLHHVVLNFLIAISLLIFMYSNLSFCKQIGLKVTLWENIYFILLTICALSFEVLDPNLTLLIIILPLIIFLIVRIYYRRREKTKRI